MARALRVIREERVTVTTVGVEIMADNPNRRGFLLLPDQSTDVVFKYIIEGSAAISTSNGGLLPAGGTAFGLFSPSSSTKMDGIVASGSASIYVVEYG